MAGRGPAPKAPGERRNKTAPQRGEWVDLPSLERPLLAELPDGDWSEETREMWEAWRADPVTAQWSASDVAYAKATIRMIEHGEAANEIRLRMDGLGLTPKGKRDLRWRIGVGGKAKPARGKPAEVRKLRAV